MLQSSVFLSIMYDAVLNTALLCFPLRALGPKMNKIGTDSSGS